MSLCDGEAGSSALSIFQVSEEKYLVTGDHKDINTLPKKTVRRFICVRTDKLKIKIVAFLFLFDKVLS